MTDENTVTSIRNYWLPFVQKYNPKVPVIIVGNKLDMIRANQNLSLFTRVGKILKPLMRDFDQVQMGIEVSAKERKNILEMLYCAQSTVIFPLSPLINLSERVLTVKYKKALARIFRILDADNSGKLSDYELSSLQQRVFDNELSPDDLKGLKDIVKEEAREHYNPRNVNLEGFYAINKHLLELMKIKNSWLILKNFGYDKKLDLVEDLFSSSLIVNNFVSVELKEKAFNFIKRLFARYAENNCLTKKHLEEIFEPLEIMPEDEIKKYSNFYFEEKLNLADWELFWR